VATLHARTEGWAAGLRLAALALRRADDPVSFLADFSGDERSVAEYLTTEILDALPPGSRDFLRAVSVCAPLPGALAAELAARPDAERMLEELRRDARMSIRALADRIHVSRTNAYARLDRLVADGVPVVVGTSRKGSLGQLTGGAPVEDRLEASVATAVWAAEQGAAMVRVHDVAPTVRALRLLAGAAA
jgi:hypothetical protein